MSLQIELYVEESDERIDRFLAEQLPDLSRSRLQKLIEQGHVQVNGQLCTSKKADVKAGDLIKLDIPDAQPLQLRPENIPLDILYEDDLVRQLQRLDSAEYIAFIQTLTTP